MYGGERVVEVLVDLLYIVLRSECCPEDWMRSLVVPLYKDGDVEVTGNYRGMLLGCCVVKVFTGMKFRKVLQGESFHGGAERFQEKRRCADQ